MDKELRDKVEMEIRHHIAPLIGWLRHDAVKGRVDTDGLRYNQWKERSALALDAIMEHVGEVEYEYAVKRENLLDPEKNYILGNFWSDKEDREDVVEQLSKIPPKDITYKLVKRRKAGKVEEL